MRLAGVQIGKPETHGEPDATDSMHRLFTSAIWKRPVTGKVRVTRLGLEGDAVVSRMHGGQDMALLAYAASHYPLWRAEWQDDTLHYGAFGENLALESVTEDTVAIGDRIRLGSATFEVSQPRQPCSTLARRHQRRDLVRIVTENGRSGWYLRVLEEGWVEMGEVATLVERVSPEWTVRLASRVMEHRAARADEARALAQCPALSTRWKEKLLETR